VLYIFSDQNKRTLMLFIICSVLGATLTAVGLYSVLWGKKKESNVSNSCNESFNRQNVEQEVKVFVDELQFQMYHPYKRTMRFLTHQYKIRNYLGDVILDIVVIISFIIQVK